MYKSYISQTKTDLSSVWKTDLQKELSIFTLSTSNKLWKGHKKRVEYFEILHSTLNF